MYGACKLTPIPAMSEFEWMQRAESVIANMITKSRQSKFRVGTESEEIRFTAAFEG